MDNNNYNQDFQQGYNVVNEPQQNSSKGKTSMICGILGAIFCFIGCFCCIGYAGIPLSIVAIVFAIQSKNETGGVFSNDAKVGFIGGIAGLVILLLGFLFGVILGAVLGAANYTF